MNTPFPATSRGQALAASIGLWLSWVIASTVSYLPGFWLALLWGSPDYVRGMCWPVMVAASALGGLWVGSFQWLVLYRRIELDRAWIIWTLLVWIFAPPLALNSLFAGVDLLATSMSFLFAGTIIGVCQWAALRRVEGAGWWIPATALAWLLGGFAGAFMLSLPLSEEIFALAGPAIIISTVTGLALVVLLEPTRRGWVTAAILTGFCAVVVFPVAFALNARLTDQSGILHTGYGVYDLAFSADGTRLAASSLDDKGVWITVWDTSNWKQVAKITARSEEGYMGVDLSADGTLAITTGGSYGSSDSQLWDIASGEELWSGAEANDVAFSRDGRLVALAYGDALAAKDEIGRIEIRDAPTGALQRQIAAQEPLFIEIYSLAFSPDGRTLASASGDSTVRLWDVPTGATLEEFPGFRVRRVSAVEFSPDGQLLILGGHAIRG